MGSQCCSRREQKLVESPFDLNLNNYCVNFKLSCTDQINEFYQARKREVRTLSTTITQANASYAAFLDAAAISVLPSATLDTVVKAFVWSVAANSSLSYHEACPFVDVPLVTTSIAQLVTTWTAFVGLLEALPSRLVELNEQFTAAIAKAEAEHTVLVSARSLTLEQLTKQLRILRENLRLLEGICAQLQRDTDAHATKLQQRKSTLKTLCAESQHAAEEAARLKLSAPKEVVKHFWLAGQLE